MNLKTNGRANGRQTLWLRFALLAAAALVLAVLVYRLIDHLGGPRRTVWVPAQDLEAGSVVTSGDLESRRVRERRLPREALDARQPIEGRELARAKSAGSPFVAADFTVGTEDPETLAQLVPEGRVLTTVRIDPTSVPFPKLRRGDRLNVLAVLPGGGTGGSVASDVYFMGWLQPNSGARREKATILGVDVSPPGLSRGGGSVSLLLALHPRHVVPMARAEAAGARLSFVLHAGSEVKDGELTVLPRDEQPKTVEVLAGGNRDTVEFQQ